MQDNTPCKINSSVSADLRQTVFIDPQENTMTDEALVAQQAPYASEVEAGKTYYWCACGRSKKQPYCDGSHKGSNFSPVAFKAEKTEKVYLCGCKKTVGQPFCDGSHKNL